MDKLELRNKQFELEAGRYKLTIAFILLFVLLLALFVIGFHYIRVKRIKNLLEISDKELKKDVKKMNKNHFDKFENLFNAIASISSVEECRLFLEDLCTIKELSDMNQRLEVAKLLSDGKNYWVYLVNNNKAQKQYIQI